MTPYDRLRTLCAWANQHHLRFASASVATRPWQTYANSGRALAAFDRRMERLGDPHDRQAQRDKAFPWLVYEYRMERVTAQLCVPTRARELDEDILRGNACAASVIFGVDAEEVERWLRTGNVAQDEGSGGR